MQRVPEDLVTTEHRFSRSIDIKRLVFDWSSIAAIGLAIMTYATLAGDVKANTNKIADQRLEIDRLRAANEIRGQSDIRIAEQMATKADVQRVSDQVQALAAELRNARLK